MSGHNCNISIDGTSQLDQNLQTTGFAEGEVILVAKNSCKDHGDDDSNTVSEDKCSETAGSCGDSTRVLVNAMMKDSTDDHNPYSYLSRGDFTSEIFKVELSNLPRRFGIAVRFTRLETKIEITFFFSFQISCNYLA